MDRNWFSLPIMLLSSKVPYRFFSESEDTWFHRLLTRVRDCLYFQYTCIYQIGNWTIKYGLAHAKSSKNFLLEDPEEQAILNMKSYNPIWLLNCMTQDQGWAQMNNIFAVIPKKICCFSLLLYFHWMLPDIPKESNNHTSFSWKIQAG